MYQYDKGGLNDHFYAESAILKSFRKSCKFMKFSLS